MSSQMMLLLALCFAAMAGILDVIPTLTRPEIFFAVLVGPDFRRTPQGRSILCQYRLTIWIFTAAAAILAIALGLPVAALAVDAIGALGALVRAHGQSLRNAAAPNSVIEVDLSTRPERLPGGAIVALLPTLSMLGLALWANFNFDRLPPRFPTHWSLEGPDHWVIATRATVFSFLAVMASVTLLLAGVAWALLHWSRRVSTSGPAAAAEDRFRRRMMQMMIVFAYFCAVPAWFALVAPETPAAMAVWGIAMVLVIVGFAVSLMRSGQGGSRAAGRVGAPALGDRTPNSCWKWGLVYVNPADPAIVVERRFGIGYTLNLGNHWTWVVMALMLAPAAVALVLPLR